MAGIAMRVRIEIRLTAFILFVPVTPPFRNESGEVRNENVCVSRTDQLMDEYIIEAYEEVYSRKTITIVLETEKEN